MKTVNRVTLLGNATRDADLKSTNNGQSVCTFGLATNRVWKDAAGERQSLAEFHNLVVWGRLAEFCAQTVKKGKPVYAEGYLKTRSYEDANGVKQQRTEIIVEDIVLLSPKEADEAAPAPSATPWKAASPSPTSSPMPGRSTKHPKRTKPLRSLSPLRSRSSPVRRSTPLKRSTTPIKRYAPLKRSSKPIARRKPLKRSAIRFSDMSADPAAFRDEDVLAVYEPSLVCFQTAKRHLQDGQPVDGHHVAGRGGKDPEDRRVHSSIFNYAPLRRDVHEGPLRDDPDQRRVYLKIAYRRVMAAVGAGRYELREEDHAFLRLYLPDLSVSP